MYPYYWPFYKAGGPVQSIYNIVQIFKGEANFYLISKNRDIDGTASPFSITENNWCKGPNDENIYYTSSLTPLLVFKIIQELRPHVILLNGIFNWQTTFFGVIFARLYGCKFIVSPRGMLQTWALDRGKVKKLIFIFVFKMLLRKKNNWHATDMQEQIDIKKIFGSRQNVSIAPNVPRALSKSETITFPTADKKIRLVFLSLINPNKNL
ncbi:MAG: hypothetical protein ACKO96_33005, partial [Flammeovirgaceae bacterium]